MQKDTLVFVLYLSTTKAQWENSHPKLEKLVANMNQIQKDVQGMEQPSPEKEKELRKKYEQKMRRTAQRFMTEMFRIQSKPELRKPLEKVMEKMK